MSGWFDEPKTANLQASVHSGRDQRRISGASVTCQSVPMIISHSTLGLPARDVPSPPAHFHRRLSLPQGFFLFV